MATDKNKNKLRAPKVADPEMSRIVTDIYDQLNKVSGGSSAAASQAIRITSVSQAQLPSNPEFNSVYTDTLIFDVTYELDGNESQGTLYWNEDEQTLSLRVNEGETIEFGQKLEVHVKNQTGEQIDKGEVVYASGTVGTSGRITVDKMIADGSIPAKRILGVTAENIPNGEDGKVVVFGKIRKIDTQTDFSEGDILWVSTTTAGALQNTEPIQANSEIALPIAFVVTEDTNNGEIFVRVTPIDENEYQDYNAGLEDISGLTPTDGNIIVGNGTNWVAESGDTARTSLGLGTGDSPTFNQVVLTNQADDGTKALRADREVNAGDGLSGGGALTSDQTLTLGTPSTTTVGGSNAVTTDSHTHALDLSGRSITLSNDSDGVLTFDTNTQNLGADRTYTPTIADHASGQRGVLSIGAQTIYGAKTFNDATTFDTSALLDDTAKIESEAGYVAGFTGSGFNLSKDTTWKLELDDMYIRGALFASEFIVNQISAVNGSDILSPGRGKVEEINSNFYTVSDPQGGNFASFAVNDIVIVQQVRPNDNQIVKRIVKQVTDVTNNVIELSTLSGAPSDVGSIEVGDIIVAIGNITNTDRQANIFRTVTDNESPYVRVNDGIASWADWTGVDKLKVQYGNLDSLTSLYPNISGYGFYGENTFLTGALLVGDLTKETNYLEYDGTNLNVVTDTFNLNSGTITLSSNGTGKIALGPNADNILPIDGIGFYADGSGNFLIGSIGQGSDSYISFDGSDLRIKTETFDLIAGEMSINSTNGVTIDENNFFKQDKTFSFGGGLLSGNGTSLSISGSGVTIDVSTFYLNATTFIIDSETNSGKIALGAILPTAYNNGSGIYFDGNGNALIGSSSGNRIQNGPGGLLINASNFNLITDGVKIGNNLSGLAPANATQTQAKLNVNFKAATSTNPVISNTIDLIESENINVIQIVFDYNISGGDGGYDIRIAPEAKDESSGSWIPIRLETPFITYPNVSQSYFNTASFYATLSDQSTAFESEFRILSGVDTYSDKVCIYFATDPDNLNYSLYNEFRFKAYHENGEEFTGSFTADMYVVKYKPSVAITSDGFSIRQSDTIYQETLLTQDKLPIRQNKSLLFV